MDFKEQIKAIAKNIAILKDSVATEEATKTAFIMPFIQALGYNVFNPLEVTPEFTADVGIKQGEKIDYAIFIDKKPVFLIECKKIGAELNILNESQLFRYFHTSSAKFGVLTNGKEYKFYSDLEEPNKMDSVPFLTFDITNMKDNQLTELRKFCKDSFDFDNILDTAADLKYSNELRKILVREMAEPSEEFVRFFTKQVYTGVATKKVIDQFTPIVKKTLLQHINDSVTDRLQAALSKESEKQSTQSDEVAEQEVSKINTTQEEMDAYHIVRAIVCREAPAERIAYRDAQSYFSVLFDDNNRKPICRLFLETENWRMIILDKDRNETKVELSSLSDIYEYEDELRATVKGYMEIEM